METNQPMDESQGDEQLGERERWDRERWLAAASSYIDAHEDEWNDLLELVDPDWFGHYWDRNRAMREYREEVIMEVAHLLEIGDLE